MCGFVLEAARETKTSKKKERENVCRLVFALSLFCVYVDFCACVCESMASKCATMTHESSHPGPWGVRAGTGRGPETTVRPATVALSCQRCQNESTRGGGRKV